jgi:ABC-type branched-subunit amino acid transport system substrate-binding protein
MGGRETPIDRRSFLKTTAAAGATLGVAGCLGGSGGEGASLGVLQPFTGEVSWVGESSEVAVNIAVDEINEAGGMNGSDVEIITEDTEANQQTATSAIRKLIDSDGVSAILGPTSFTLPAVMNIAQESQVPIISPTAGTSVLDDMGGEYVFRTAMSDSLGGRAMARIAYDNGYDEIAVMYVDNQGGRSFGQTVIDGFEALGGTVTTDVALTPGKSSYRSELTKAFESDPEFVSLTAGTETGQIVIEQWAEQDLGGVWGLSDDMQTATFAEELGSNLEGSYALGPLTGGDKYDEFATEYESRANESPQPFTAEAYDATMLAALAAQAAESNQGSDLAGQIISASRDGDVVTSFEAGADALGNGANIDYNGASGPVDLTDRGNILSAFAVFQSTGSAWEQTGEIPAEDLEF